MASHSFKVGQMVRYTPGRTVSVATSREYKIIQQLPPSEGQNQYRIKSPAENFERMARENDLSRR